jgi:hypothetical protein
MRYFTIVFLLSIFLLAGCPPFVNKSASYEEIPSMLNVLTNSVQSAVEQGYFNNGEQAVIDYVRSKNPNIIDWFEENNFNLRVDVVEDIAVVMVCGGHGVRLASMHLAGFLGSPICRDLRLLHNYDKSATLLGG